MPTRRGAAERGCASVLHVLYLIFNEGYASSARQRAPARRALGRGDPLDADAAPAAARRGRGRRPARADAAHRRPAPCAHRRRRRADPARRTGPDALGSDADRRRDRAPRRARSAGRRSASTSSRPRSPRYTTARRRADDTDWPQILALYGLLEQLTRQPGRDAQPRRRRGDGRRPGGGSGRARHRRRAAGRPLPPRRSPRAPAGDGRRHGGRASSTTVPRPAARRTCRSSAICRCRPRGSSRERQSRPPPADHAPREADREHRQPGDDRGDRKRRHQRHAAHAARPRSARAASGAARRAGSRPTRWRSRSTISTPKDEKPIAPRRSVVSTRRLITAIASASSA